MNTPIADFVRGYEKKNMARLHMPGHKGKTFLGCEAFDITENFITVTIPLRKLASSIVENVTNVHDELTQTQRKILELIKNNSGITVDELSSVVGVSTTSISTDIKKLKEINLLRREGSKKTGHWVIL